MDFGVNEKVVHDWRKKKVLQSCLKCKNDESWKGATMARAATKA